MATDILSMIEEFLLEESEEPNYGKEFKADSWLTELVIKRDPRLAGQLFAEAYELVFPCVENIRESVGIRDAEFSNSLITLLKTSGFSLKVIYNSKEGETLIYFNDLTAGRIRAKKPIDQLGRRPFNGLVDNGERTIEVAGVTITFVTIEGEMSSSTLSTKITESEFVKALSNQTSDWEFILSDLKALLGDQLEFREHINPFSKIKFLIAGNETLMTVLFKA